MSMKEVITIPQGIFAMSEEHITFLRENIQRISNDVSEVKTEIREVTVKLGEMKAIEERIANLLKQGDANAAEIRDLWKAHTDLQRENKSLAVALESTKVKGDGQGAAMLRFFGYVATFISAVLLATFLGK